VSKPKLELYVLIIESESEEEVKRMGPFVSSRTAAKVESGAGINLNWDRFHTVTVSRNEDGTEEEWDTED
jgi:hypothetical protein